MSDRSRLLLAHASVCVAGTAAVVAVLAGAAERACLRSQHLMGAQAVLVAALVAWAAYVAPPHRERVPIRTAESVGIAPLACGGMGR